MAAAYAAFRPTADPDVAAGTLLRAPAAGVQVDVWHANAAGRYSEVHVHLKLRTFAGAVPTSRFTSQLFFDDAVTDRVMARAPYDSRGPRDTTNATDGIVAGTTPLLLTLAEDGSGGWVGTFEAAVDGLPATTGG